ncbi:MAG: hypothetical protein HIU85_07955 [Proteobacteria bacterium]|nr:hypothetical protein [Pseudomonadota bacterium]
MRLYAIVRPAGSRDFLERGAKSTDLVIMREATEGSYPDRNMFKGIGGIMPTPDVALSVRKVHAQFPDMKLDDAIIDAMAAHPARDPSRHDVIVSTNFYSDILSDLAGELSDSLGLAGPIHANAEEARVCAQAQHGCAPDIQGRDIANPASRVLIARPAGLISRRIPGTENAQSSPGNDRPCTDRREMGRRPRVRDRPSRRPHGSHRWRCADGAQPVRSAAVSHRDVLRGRRRHDS